MVFFRYRSDPSLLRAVVGTISRISGGKSYDISKIFIHELYCPSTLVNDIALLGTAKKISFSQSVLPITFAPSDFKVSDGAEAIISGFGTTSVSQLISYQASYQNDCHLRIAQHLNLHLLVILPVYHYFHRLIVFQPFFVQKI